MEKGGLIHVDYSLFVVAIATSKPVSSDPQLSEAFYSVTHEDFYNRVKSGELLDYRIEESPGFCHSGISYKDILEATKSDKICLINCQPKVGCEVQSKANHLLNTSLMVYLCLTLLEHQKVQRWRAKTHGCLPLGTTYQ